MERTGFESLLERLGQAWNRGDARGAAACFAELVDYADPLHYRFGTRTELEAFFAPPPSGHHVTWHRLLFDASVRTGMVEYTYVGHHRYHGAAIVEIDSHGRISRWREWQHLDDVRDWDAYVQGSAS